MISKESAQFPPGFTWGVASSAYQVEGGWKADGKGLSVWDVYTNDYGITVPMTGKEQTGNVAINEYEREQYLRDIFEMKKLGINSYRFSIAWSRVLPMGTGPVNEKGIFYYSRLINDLLEAGIEPMITLFHWDLPRTLAEKGGWDHPDSVSWFKEYASLVFERFGSRVKKFITFNEPYIDLFMIEPLVHQIMRTGKIQFPVPEDQILAQLRSSFHWMMAHGEAVAEYKRRYPEGKIGITLSISPAYPAEDKEWDLQAARIADGLHNRWFLEAVFNGRFPGDIIQLFSKMQPLDFDPEKLESLKNHPIDFLGVNYYSSHWYRANPKAPFGIEALPNTDKNPSYNGPVYPQGLTELLVWIDKKYGSPEIYITENGAGFGPEDDKLENGRVNDVLRAGYLTRHIEAAGKALQQGVKLKGYFAWSIFDNFEWLFGYSRRFGLIYVDFATQQRIWKKSAFTYRDLILESRKK